MLCSSAPEVYDGVRADFDAQLGEPLPNPRRVVRTLPVDARTDEILRRAAAVASMGGEVG